MSGLSNCSAQKTININNLLINRHTYTYEILEGIGVCMGVPAKRGQTQKHSGGRNCLRPARPPGFWLLFRSPPSSPPPLNRQKTCGLELEGSAAEAAAHAGAWVVFTVGLTLAAMDTLSMQNQLST